MPEPTTFWSRLSRKTAIVTGAGSQESGVGTGAAIARIFAREGARICIVDQDADRASATASLIAETGGEAFIALGDVTDAADCDRIVAATLEHYGQLDILVNNVGAAVGSGQLDGFDEKAWNRAFDVNVKSALLMTKAAVGHLAKTTGAVVNIGSLAGLRALGLYAYGPSKAALVALTRELAVIYGRDGVRVNCVSPGHIATPMAMGAGAKFAPLAMSEDKDDIHVRRAAVAPLGIVGDAWDIASAALFLASDEARFITAAVIPVDGGVAEVAALTASNWVQRS